MTEQARVISTTRKYVEISPQVSPEESVLGKNVSHDLKICVGDIISYESRSNQVIILESLERKNLLLRSDKLKSKELVANSDLLFLITAPGNLLKLNFLDRLLVAASSQEIEVVIVLNKSDLKEDFEKARQVLKIYEDLGIEVIESSTKTQNGISSLISKVKSKEKLELVSLIGMSGVGKSSIINCLTKTESQRISSVSKKSGQGRQTTTQSKAIYCKDIISGHPFYLVDLPGVQNFGLSHLSKDEIKMGFKELSSMASCKFNDCNHINEPGCLVLEALSLGKIAKSRYESYLNIISTQELS